MRHERLVVLAGVGAVSVSALLALVSCLSDPRESEAVLLIDKCDTALLSNDPASFQPTLRAYVASADMLLKLATATEAALRDACNAINKDLGLPTTGTDASGACNAIAARLQNILNREAPAPPAALGVTHFVEISFPKTCTAAPGALEACLSACAGPCDTSKCEPGKLAGTCNGDCLGSCTETSKGAPIACRGSCAGETLGLDNAQCQGECVGTCTSPVWTGSCTASCAKGFDGFCAGHCTGLCITGSNNDVTDAGALNVDALAPVAQPPGGADGNCPGKCKGLCSQGASGECSTLCLTYQAGPPVGTFSAGFCGRAGTSSNCTGACRSPDNGSIDRCSGSCTQLGKTQCDGVCRNVADAGGCTGPLTNAFCEGAVGCGQNVQCNNACQATALLAATCTEPVAASLILATDKPLYDALTKYAGPLGKAVNQLEQTRAALAFISITQFGDFKTLGLSGDLLRVCVDEGRKNVLAADALISAAGNANPVVYRKIK